MLAFVYLWYHTSHDKRSHIKHFGTVCKERFIWRLFCINKWLSFLLSCSFACLRCCTSCDKRSHIKCFETWCNKLFNRWTLSQSLSTTQDPRKQMHYLQNSQIFPSLTLCIYLNQLLFHIRIAMTGSRSSWSMDEQTFFSHDSRIKWKWKIVLWADTLLNDKCGFFCSEFGQLLDLANVQF